MKINFNPQVSNVNFGRIKANEKSQNVILNNTNAYNWKRISYRVNEQKSNDVNIILTSSDGKKDLDATVCSNKFNYHYKKDNTTSVSEFIDYISDTANTISSAKSMGIDESSLKFDNFLRDNYPYKSKVPVKII